MENRQSYTPSPTKKDARASFSPTWKSNQRYYASPEEDGLPVFTTPTAMYINPKLNPSVSATIPPQKYAPTPQHQQTRAYNYTSQFDPLFKGHPTTSASTQYTSERKTSSPLDNKRKSEVRPSFSSTAKSEVRPQYTPNKYDVRTQYPPNKYSAKNEVRPQTSPVKTEVRPQYTPKAQSEVRSHYTPAGKSEIRSHYTPGVNNESRSQYSPKNEVRPQYTPSASPSPQDIILSQLVEMGFSVEKSRIALIASENKTLQEALDLLLQGARQEKKLPKQTPDTPYKATNSQHDTFVDEERRQGNYLFNKGQFKEAEAAYTHAIQSLPLHHPGLVLLSNNRAAARLKLGMYQECITDCNRAIEMARKNMIMNTPIVNQKGVVSWKNQLMKALRRKGNALEGIGSNDLAYQAYKEYLSYDPDSYIKQCMLRCQQTQSASSPSDEPTAFPDIDFNVFISDDVGQSKAVQEMRARERKKEAEEAEKLKKSDQVDAQLDQWKAGKERNLRSLLTSLDLILWKEVAWKPVEMKDILDPRRCKITYMKAIAKVHPDKLSAQSTIEQRMLANGIFTTLNQAWDLFKSENTL